MSTGIVESTQQQQQEEGSVFKVSRTQLVQRLSAASSDLPTFVNDLVTTQAIVVAGSEAAGFAVEQSDGTVGLRKITHLRPGQSTPEARAAAIAAFQEMIQPCVEQDKDGAIEVGVSDATTEPQFCLVTLLRNQGKVVAASAVITRCRDHERARQRLMSMQLVGGYFDLYTLKRTSDQSKLIAESHQHVLQLANSVATADGFEQAAVNLCNELAGRTGASRVSLGWVKGRNVKVKALSNTDKFDKKQELIVQLERVMEECRDQEEAVQFDPKGENSENVTRSASEFSRSQGGATVLSLPLRRKGEVEGVVTLEFAPEHKLSEQASTGLAVAVDLLAPQLYDRYQNDRWLITKAGLSAREGAKAVIGPKHMVAKLVVTLLMAAAVFVALYSPMYHVSAPFQFAPVTRHLVSAPFEGTTIKEVFAKPGDVVREGDLLMQLDATDLELRLNEANSEVARYRREAERFRSANPPEIADMHIAEADADMAQARADLLSRQIAQARIVAPADGEVMRGDHLDRRGAPVQRGEVLFEIARRDRLRAELTVAERDIQRLSEGQTGRLATAGLPSERYPFTVDRIVPIAEARDGGNVFKVYAALSENPEEVNVDWRPGMIGEAKVEIGERPLVWIWTHRVVDFVRLKLWW